LVFPTERHSALRIIRTDIDLENAISPAGLQFEMSRYKGQLRASRTEQEFPHHVDIIVPPVAWAPGSTRCTSFTLSTASSHSAAKANRIPMAQLFAGALQMGV